MTFFKRTNGYSANLAEEALSNELVKLVGKQLVGLLNGEVGLTVKNGRVELL